MMNRRSVNNIAGMYDMEDTIGSGHFAVVKVARHVFTGLRVAVKVIDKLKLDEMSRAHLFQEVKCMKLVFHPNIIRLYEVIDTQTKLYLILELAEGGDLYDFICKHEKGVEEGLARSIFRDIVSAISYCHKLHIVHRDLKPENLVFCNIKSTPVVKLTDFGLSRSFMPGEMLDTACGSLEYSAPEILLGESYKAPTVDVWSLGVILFMLIVGRSPFSYGSPNETLTHIMDGKYSVPSTVSAQCKHLIASMLQVDVNARATMDQIYYHPWLAQSQSVTAPMPLLSTLAEITPDDKDFILHRMEQGNFGGRDAIIKAITDSPYSSTAATFYLLAEAELHRRLHKEHSIDSPLKRKLSVPAKFQRFGLSPRLFNDNTDGDAQPSGLHGVGSAEKGVLRSRKNISSPMGPASIGFIGTPISAHYRRVTTQCESPLDQMQQATPMDIAVKWVGPPSSFPINTMDSQEEDNTTTTNATSNATPNATTNATPKVTNEDSTPISNYLHGKGLRPRLSTFEEESESETSVHTGGSSSRASPVPSIFRPSAILSNSPTMKERSGSMDRVRSITRLSPSMRKQNSFSRSDGSDDAESEEDDEIVELLTASGNYSNTLSMLRKRLERGSSAHSPHLSRKSPTHCWTGSSDEEAANLLDDNHKRRSKHRVIRERSKSKKNRIRRVDSASSDDGTMESSRKGIPLLKCSSNKYPGAINVPAINVENCKKNSTDEAADCTADVLRELMDLKSVAKKIELSDEEFDADNYSISETDSKTDLSKTDLLQGIDPMQVIQELPSPPGANDDIIPLTDFKEFNGRVATPSAVSLHVADQPSSPPATSQVGSKPNVVRTSICDVL